MRCTEAALRSTALHTAGPRGGWSRKVSRRWSLQKLERKSVWRGGREVRGAPRHAEFSRWGEWFHAAVVNSGGDRSWISAAVSLSMTLMGPPHLGQR